MDTAPTSTTWIKDLLKAARIASGKTQLEFGEELGASQTSISQWERGEQTPSVEVLARLLPHFGGDLNRARPDYDPAADVLRVAEIPSEYRPKTEAHAKAMARLVAETRRQVLGEVAAARPAPLALHPIDDATGAILPAVAHVPGLDPAPMAALFPLWNEAGDPTRLLRRAADVEGDYEQETLAVRAARQGTPLFSGARILARHPKTRVETLCRLMGHLTHGRPSSLICVPILTDRPTKKSETWALEIDDCTGLIVAFLSAPPIPTGLLDPS